MKNKFLILCLALVLVCTSLLSGCASKEEKSETNSMKAGFICLHDENSTYDLNFINAAKAACDELGVTQQQQHTNTKKTQQVYK